MPSLQDVSRSERWTFQNSSQNDEKDHLESEEFPNGEIRPGAHLFGGASGLALLGGFGISPFKFGVSTTEGGPGLK
jgi:hypothetical protein